MATRTVTGYITVTDVADGRGGITTVVSNENHTFAADADGAVTNANRNAYKTRVEVYVETTKYSLDADGAASPDASTFSINSITLPAGSGMTSTQTADTSTPPKYVDITFGSSGGMGFFQGGNNSPDTVSIVLDLRVNIGGNTVSVMRTITLSKAKGGTASLLTLDQTSYLLPINVNQGGDRSAKNAANTIIFTAAPENITGNDDVAWSYRVGTQGAFTTIAVGTQTGTRKVTLTLTHAQLLTLIGTTARAVTIKAALGGKEDLGSVGIVQDGQAGFSEVVARIIARGSTTLRNSATTSTVTLDAKLFYKGAAADGAILAVKTTANDGGYQWFTRAANANTEIGTAAGRMSSLIVRASDAAVAGGAALYGCHIKYDDTHAQVNT